MGLPGFATDVVDIDTPEAVSRVFDDFTRDITREDLFLGAEWYVKNRTPMCSVYTYRGLPGGLMRVVIGQTVMKPIARCSVSFSLTTPLFDRLMDYYGFTQESIPPRMLAREAVALMVRYNSVMSDLERELDCAASAFCYDLNVDDGVKSAAKDLLSPDDAYFLSDEAVDAIIR